MALLWAFGVLFGLVALGAILPEPEPAAPEPDPAVVSAATWKSEWPFVVESGRLRCGAPPTSNLGGWGTVCSRARTELVGVERNGGGFG